MRVPVGPFLYLMRMLREQLSPVLLCVVLAGGALLRILVTQPQLLQWALPSNVMHGISMTARIRHFPSSIATLMMLILPVLTQYRKVDYVGTPSIQNCVTLR